MNVYRKLKIVLNSRQKKRVVLLCILIFFSALMELLSVGIIIPLITAVVSPDTILENEKVKFVLGLAGLENIDPRMSIFLS